MDPSGGDSCPAAALMATPPTNPAIEKRVYIVGFGSSSRER
jgi:hypothetical protein